MMIMKLILTIIAFTIFICTMFYPRAIHAQEEQLPTTLEFYTEKIGKDSRLFKAILTIDDGSSIPDGSDIDITFFGMSDGKEHQLSTASPEAKGTASFLADDLSGLTANESGYYKFTARFEGNDAFGPSEASLEVMDAWLQVEFFEEDSEKYIRYSGYFTAADGSVSPIADQDVYLYTPKMFSLMMFEEGWLESEGMSVSEFPVDLIGDTLGNIEIIVKIEDHPDFGNVQASGISHWAIPKHSESAEGPSRELWTPIAPLWMIVTLIILLTGVWSHYFYAVWQLYKIKHAGKKDS